LHRATHEIANAGLNSSSPKGDRYFSFEKGDYVTLFEAPKSLIVLKKAAVSRALSIGQGLCRRPLETDGRVVGAVGIGLVDGKTYISTPRRLFLQPAVALYARKNLWRQPWRRPCNGLPAGPVVESEFGALRVRGQVLGKQFMGIHVYLRLENALGENIMKKYYPRYSNKSRSSTRTTRAIEAMMREVSRDAPIYLD